MNQSPEMTVVSNKSIHLDYASLEGEIMDLIGHQRCVVLSTASENRVTARMMSVINLGLKIYFQSSSTSTKWKQMLANPLVALCASNIQIEGVARFCGHPLAPENSFFAEAYSRKHSGSFATYSHLPEAVLVEVVPVFVTLWKYSEEGLPFRDFLDIKNHDAWREYYPVN